MPYYYYAWIASVTSGIYVVITKLTSKYTIDNHWYFNFLWTLISLLFTIPFALINHAGLPHEWKFLIFASIFSVLSRLFFIISVSALDVSSLAPIFNFRTVFTVIIGSIFLSEFLSLYQWFIVAIMISMGALTTISEKFHLRSFLKPAIIIAILMTFFIAVNSAFIKLSMVKNDIWTINVWMLIIQLLMLLPTIPLFIGDLKKIKFNQILPVGAMGFLTMITNITSSVANGVNIGITSLIMAIPFSMLIAFVLSIFMPKLLEKHTLKVYAIRFTAAAIMIYGAFQLTR